MTTPAFVGVDAGTSGCKAVLCAGDGRVLASAARSYEAHRGTDGSVVQDARDWVAAVSATVREVVAQAEGVRVEALGLTAPAHNAVLVGEDAEPLAPVLLWSDARPHAVAEELRTAFGAEFFERTLVRLGPAWTLPQLVWLQRACPDVWARTRRVLVGKDYLRYVLTGVAATDPSDAAGTALYDQSAGTWWAELCTEAGIAEGLLPPVRRPTELAGGLDRAWADATGLAEGTPVAVGATDTAAELVSVGATEPGAGLVKIASTGTVVQVVDGPRSDPRLLCYPHPEPGRWYLIAATNTAATAHAWLCRQLGRLDHPVERPLGGLVEAAETEARRAPPGSGGLLFLPFLEGERTPYWDPRLRGAFLGLSSSHGVAHLSRAVLEGVALGLRGCRDLLADLGHRLDAPALTGGGARSALWRSILTSALGQQGRVVTPHGPALGAAMLAASALGAPLGAAGRRSEREVPVDAWVGVYDELYALFVQAVGATSALGRRLEALGREQAGS